jgi:FtsP/CotA-like multicopper oxidase with cupredoxin domain
LTLRLRRGPGAAVTLAVRFEQYAGLYVLHCHNREHEDAGA